MKEKKDLFDILLINNPHVSCNIICLYLVTQELEERARMMKQRIIRQAENGRGDLSSMMPHSDSEGPRTSREHRTRSQHRHYDSDYDFRLGRDIDRYRRRGRKGNKTYK